MFRVAPKSCSQKPQCTANENKEYTKMLSFQTKSFLDKLQTKFKAPKHLPFTH